MLFDSSTGNRTTRSTFLRPSLNPISSNLSSVPRATPFPYLAFPLLKPYDLFIPILLFRPLSPTIFPLTKAGLGSSICTTTVSDTYQFYSSQSNDRCSGHPSSHTFRDLARPCESDLRVPVSPTSQILFHTYLTNRHKGTNHTKRPPSFLALPSPIPPFVVYRLTDKSSLCQCLFI